MRRAALTLIFAFIFLFTVPQAFGQFTIYPKVDMDSIAVPDLKARMLENPEQYLHPFEYKTEAMRRAERIELRRKRNLFTLEVSVNATMSQYANWSKGSNNTFEGLSTLKMNYSHKRDKFGLSIKFDSRLGMGVLDSITYKKDDWFEFKTDVSWDISKSWKYSGGVTWTSQYMKGYESPTNKTLKSDFMAPGTIKIGLGFNFKPPGSGLDIDIYPLTGELLFVLNDELSEKGKHGVDKGSHFKPKIGPSINANYRKKFAKDVLEWESTLRAFNNFRTKPNVTWSNKLDIRALKFLTTSLYCMTKYIPDEMPEGKEDRIQVNYSMGIGISYKFQSRK